MLLRWIQKAAALPLKGWKDQVDLTPEEAVTWLEDSSALHGFCIPTWIPKGRCRGFPIDVAAVLRACTAKQLIVAGGIEEERAEVDETGRHGRGCVWPAMAVYSGAMGSVSVRGGNLRSDTCARGALVCAAGWSNPRTERGGGVAAWLTEKLASRYLLSREFHSKEVDGLRFLARFLPVLMLHSATHFLIWRGWNEFNGDWTLGHGLAATPDRYRLVRCSGVLRHQWVCGGTPVRSASVAGSAEAGAEQVFHAPPHAH